jgi:hypothetical protein
MSSVVQLGLDSKSRKLDIQIALKSRIANRHAKVGIIGLGYVGLPLAQVFVRAGEMLGAPAGGRPGGTASGGACSQWKRPFDFLYSNGCWAGSLASAWMRDWKTLLHSTGINVEGLLTYLRCQAQHRIQS